MIYILQNIAFIIMTDGIEKGKVAIKRVRSRPFHSIFSQKEPAGFRQIADFLQVLKFSYMKYMRRITS
jgi:hypothetical protein